MQDFRVCVFYVSPWREHAARHCLTGSPLTRRHRDFKLTDFAVPQHYHAMLSFSIPRCCTATVFMFNPPGEAWNITLSSPVAFQ